MKDKTLSIVLIVLVAIAGFYFGAPHVIEGENHFYHGKGRMEREHRIRLNEAITLEVTSDWLEAFPDYEPEDEYAFESGDELWAEAFDEDGNAVGLYCAPCELGGMIPADEFEDITEEYESKLEADYESQKEAGLEAFQKYRSHLKMWPVYFLFSDTNGGALHGLAIGGVFLVIGLILYRILLNKKAAFITCWSILLNLLIFVHYTSIYPCR
ncbi:hypothetical protein SAMN05216413_0698 [Ruminococcaceae bacterium KH2T8]|nr:hypothetical protein SAMN05216413_0698 [Ruminococcaceae bacterium KH2T8]